MSEKIPLRALLDEDGNPAGLREFSTGETIPKTMLPEILVEDISLLPEALSDKVSNEDFSAEVARIDGELEDRYTINETDDLIATRTTPAEAAAAAPVQQVEGRSGANVTLSDLFEAKRQNNLSATTDPGPTNDETEGYEVLSRWVNTVTRKKFVCLHAAEGDAFWDDSTLSIDELGSAALLDSGEAPEQLPDNALVDAKLLAIQEATHYRMVYGAYTPKGGMPYFPPNSAVNYEVGEEPENLPTMAYLTEQIGYIAEALDEILGEEA